MVSAQDDGCRRPIAAPWRSSQQTSSTARSRTTKIMDSAECAHSAPVGTQTDTQSGSQADAALPRVAQALNADSTFLSRAPPDRQTDRATGSAYDVPYL